MAVRELCGLFVSVHDSKLSFIHLTAREFLLHRERQGTWQGCMNLLKSHSTISRSCISYLLLLDIPAGYEPAGYTITEDKEPPFLLYAAHRWPSHYVAQEATDADNFRQDARLLCHVDGHQARVWAPRYYRHNIRWNYRRNESDLALACDLGLKQVVEDILLMEKVDANSKGGTSGTPLKAAASMGHVDVVEVLLADGADVNFEGSTHTTALREASEGGYYKVCLLACFIHCNFAPQKGLRTADANYGVIATVRWSSYS